MQWLGWLGGGVALLVVEVSTLAFVAAYFGVGALAAALAAGLGAPVLFQVAESAAFSGVLLLLTRPLLLRYANQGRMGEMNQPEIAGRAGVVTVAIADDQSVGQIRLGSEFWTARLAAGERAPLAVGTAVEVVDVLGL